MPRNSATVPAAVISDESGQAKASHCLNRWEGVYEEESVRKPATREKANNFIFYLNPKTYNV